MAYAASNTQYKSNQLMVISLAMFGAIVAAIVVSTLLVMSLMRGEFANAVADVNTNAPTTQTISAGSDVCTGTSAPQTSGSAVHGTSPAGKKHWNGSINNSYNNTNTSTSSVTNNVSETTTTNTMVNTISDSFNLGSYNQEDSHDVDNSDNSVTIDSSNTNTDSHDVEVEVEVEVEIEDSILVAL